MLGRIREHLFIVSSFALGLVVGIVATLLLKSTMPATFFDTRLMEILQLFVFILGFTVFSYFVTKHHSDHRRRIDFLYDRVGLLKDQLQRDFTDLDFSLAHFDSPQTKKKVLMACRSLSNSVETLHSATRENDTAHSHADNLRKDVNDIRQLLTGDDWDSVEELTREQIQQTERAVRNIHSELDRFVVALFK